MIGPLGGLIASLAAGAMADQYSASSPHYAHINLFDFGRGLHYISDPATHQQAEDWFTQHIDVHEDDYTPTAGLNPGMKSFVYQLDISICQHANCSFTDAANPALAGYVH